MSSRHKPTKVVRITRHSALPEQVGALQKLYGTIRLIEKPVGFDNYDELRQLVLDDTPDVLDVVLPDHLLDPLVNEFGTRIPIISSKMRRVLQAAGRTHFVFDHYEQIVEFRKATIKL